MKDKYIILLICAFFASVIILQESQRWYHIVQKKYSNYQLDKFEQDYKREQDWIERYKRMH